MLMTGCRRGGETRSVCVHVVSSPRRHGRHDLGRLAARAERHGGALGMIHGLIAATALHHGYTVVTRNITDFAVTGVS